MAAKLILGATLKELPGVGHYDFISECTKAGDALIPICPTKAQRADTHRAAIDFATAFFTQVLGAP